FHQVVVGRIGRRLQDKDVLASHILLNFDEDFLVGEAPYAGLAQLDVEVARNRLGQHPVGIAREKFHVPVSMVGKAIGLLAPHAAIASVVMGTSRSWSTGCRLCGQPGLLASQLASCSKVASATACMVAGETALQS